MTATPDDKNGDDNESRTERLTRRLQQQIDRLDEAIARARMDEVDAMDGMDNDVQALCAEILAAPVEVGHAVQPRVASMIARLDMLESELRLLRERAIQRGEDREAEE
jgi:hypothetical protein